MRPARASFRCLTEMSVRTLLGGAACVSALLWLAIILVL